MQLQARHKTHVNVFPRRVEEEKVKKKVINVLKRASTGSALKCSDENAVKHCP